MRREGQEIPSFRTRRENEREEEEKAIMSAQFVTGVDRCGLLCHLSYSKFSKT